MKNMILLILPQIIMANEFKKIGKGLLTFSFFKIEIYEITYYRSEKGIEKLVLDYKKDIEKKYSIKGWKEGFKHIVKKDKLYEDKSDWFFKNIIDFQKGDKLIITKNGNNVSLNKDGTLIAEITDKIIAEMAFEPWLGEIPVDIDLKKKLLAN